MTGILPDQVPILTGTLSGIANQPEHFSAILEYLVKLSFKHHEG